MPRFIRITGQAFIPELSFLIDNDTTSRWDLDLTFHIGGLCKENEVREWTVSITPDAGENEIYADRVVRLFGLVNACRTKVYPR